MYLFLCLMIAISSGLIVKACLFHVQHLRWPHSPQELLHWPMRLSSKIIVSLWAGIWLLGGLSKPMGSLSSTGLIICLIASLPVVIFSLLWWLEQQKNRQKKRAPKVPDQIQGE